MVASDAAYLLLGFSYEHAETVGEFWAWTGLAWLEMTAYAYVVALVVWVVRSKAAGIVFAALIPSGFLESMLLAAAVGLAPAFPMINDAVKWLPLSTQQLLSAGGTQVFAAGDAAAVAGLPVAGQVLIVFGVLVAVCVGLALAACPRKDVA